MYNTLVGFLQGGGGIFARQGTGTAASGAVTVSNNAGKITSEALTTAAGAAYTLTITDADIRASDIVFASVANGTNTQGVVELGTVTPADGSLVVVVRNNHASQAFNGTLVVSFFAVKA